MFLTGFLDLSGSRPVGFGIAPIPWNAIHQYCEGNDIEGTQRDDMFFHLVEMDKTYCQHHAKKQKT